MDSIESARDFLDQQLSLAIWYAEYVGDDEFIRFANPTFAEIFNLSVSEILQREKYHLVNPPETSKETLQQYKSEDQHAMKSGHYLAVVPTGEQEQLIVLKLKFDNGILGLFKTIESAEESNSSLQNLDDDFQEVLKRL